MGKALKVLVAIAGLAFIVGVVRENTQERAADPLLSGGPAASPAAPACSEARIKIVSTDAGFVDECRRTPCPGFKGVGVLRNTCDIPVGVQLKVTALDASGKPLATRDLWPASTQNIPPGDYTFSMDTWLDHDERMTDYRVEVIRVKAW